MGNSNFHNARRAKNDEFYTQYETIEDELKYYKKHFEGKTVYCNCDDPRWSNFFKYFVDNFHELKLKRLIASCYVDQSYNLFTISEEREPAVWANYDGWLIDGRVPEISEIEVKELNGDGDFRSEESIEFLKQADVVVTNPPFSLFREFVPMLMKYGKSFLIIGPYGSLKYKDIFPLVKNGKIWLGASKGSMTFELPEDTESETYFIDKVDRKKKQSLGNACWWTNIDYGRTHEDIMLFREYKGNEDKYPKYDNYDAINVDNIADIPKDYEFPMGVPMGIIGQCNPEQFEILGQTTILDNSGLYNGKLKTKDPVVNGQKLYTRIFIRNKRLNPDIYGG